MAQMKDYKYGSNAAVLKDRVNGGDTSQNNIEPPVQNNKGVIGNPSMPKNTKGVFGGKYDETKWRDGPVPPTFRGVPSTVGSGAPNRP